MVKHHVFLGASGSGKTELSINFAVNARMRSEKTVCFFDMDQTKGLFRSRDFFDMMSDHGIDTVDTYDFQDAPVVPAGISGKINNEGNICVFDVGGNAAGAVMIRQYTGRMKPEDTAYYYVINPCRPFAGTAEDIGQGMAEILTASGVQPEWIRIISNPNMGDGTTAELILERHKTLESQMAQFGMEIAALCSSAKLAGEIAGCVNVPLIPLHLYLRKLY